jgi:hypothetical protein
MHYLYLPFMLYTLPNFGAPQPYRYHFKLQWTSSQAQWEFYTALLRSQDRSEFTREEPYFLAISGPYEKSHCIRGQGNVSPCSKLVLWCY